MIHKKIYNKIYCTEFDTPGKYKTDNTQNIDI